MFWSPDIISCMYWIYPRPLYGKAFHATQNVYSESCNPVWPGSVFPEWPGQARHSMQPRNDCFSGLLQQWGQAVHQCGI